MKNVQKIICVFICSVQLTFLTAQDTTQQVVSGRHNSKEQETKPYVILISADGFRFDLAEKYHATNLLKLRQQGVAAKYMTPSFPSVTFPNHYTIVTGLYPSHHGLVDNTFYDWPRQATYSMGNKKFVADGTWYGGTPLWVLAEKQQMVSASFYWVASESNIQNTNPTYYYIYNDKIPIDSRIQTVKDWLQLPEDKRPHLITFYFPEVDHAEHDYGTESKQTEDAVHFVDESVGKLNAAVASLHLPVNFIFVSDHGMTNVDTVHSISRPLSIDTSKFIVPFGDVLIHMYAKNKNDIQPAYEALKKEATDYDVYLAENMPARWHYSKADDRYNRLGDIILVARLPEIFNFSRRRVTPGKHGYDNAFPDMRASFYAWGPAFKNNMVIDGFENVNVYPLIAHILGLTYPANSIDGKFEVLQDILK